MSSNRQGGGTHRLPGGGRDHWLAALYEEQRPRLYSYLWGRTASRQDALDLVQEVFVRAVRHAETLRAMTGERRVYWLFAAARRLCIDRHRRDAATTRLNDALEGALGQAPVTLLPEAAIEDAEAWRRVNDAIAELPPTMREVLAMTVLGEMDSLEIGAVLGIAPATARYRLMRARRLLRERLGLPHRPKPFTEEVQDA